MRKTQLGALLAAALISSNAAALDLLQAYRAALQYDSQFASAKLQRDAGREQEVVGTQLEQSLSELTANEMMRIIIAYEPVWAIGTGRTATPVQAQEMHQIGRAHV